jgi:dienelactone hydrolase
MLQKAMSRQPRGDGSPPALLTALCLVLGVSLGVGCVMPWPPDPPDEPKPGHGPLPGCPGRPPVPRPPTVEAYASPGPYGFAVREFVFIDSSRPTPPNRAYPGAPQRTLPTRVYYPACPPDTAASIPAGPRIPVAAGGPFPLLAYAHGLTASGEARIAEHLASHGYITVAPRFPLSSRVAPGGPTFQDIANQPADVAFVMRQVALLSGADTDLGAAVDSRRRGLVGFSAGGLTTLIAAHHPVLALDGIQAAVAQAPVSCFLGPAFFERPLPTLILAGTADELVPIAGPRGAFALAPPPVTLMELLGGTHSGFMNRELPFITNSDTPECQLLLDSGATEGEVGGRFEQDITRGVGPGVLHPTQCTPLCSERFTQTMGATRQRTLNYAATLAHFEATLRERGDAAFFLTHVLAAQPDVQVFREP